MDTTIVDGLIIAVIGMVVVFIILIILMAVIAIMGQASKLNIKKGSKLAFAGEGTEASQPSISDKALSKNIAPGSCGEIGIFDVPNRTAAMVMAVAADELDTPLNELRFKSIREIGENTDEV